MFFISCSDGDVYRSELGGVTEFKIADLNSTNHGSNYLELRESAADTNYWDLVAVSRPRETMTVVPSISSQQRIPAQQAWRTGQYWGWGVAAFQVGEATNSPWSFHWAHWPDIGMWARNGTRVVRVAYATPFGGWAPYRVIHLPGDQALLQLGQQICLVDIPNKKIALLRKGYGVIAFHESQMTPPNERADERPGLSLLTNLTSAAAVLQER